METTSGKSKASCSAANAALPSANTRQRPWRRCRRIAPRRTSSSPAHHLTPALPTVPPVLPKTLLTLNFTTHTHDWQTHRDTCFDPPWTFQWTCTISPLLIKTADHQLSHRTRPAIKSSEELTACNMNSRGQWQHAQQGSQGHNIKTVFTFHIYLYWEGELCILSFFFFFLKIGWYC